MDSQPPIDNSATLRLVKRRIRKGTTSCWECKRRKTACKFPDPTSQKCAFCSHRGLRCLAQDYVQEGDPRSDAPLRTDRKKPQPAPPRPLLCAAPQPVQCLPTRVQVFDSVLFEQSTQVHTVESRPQTELDELSAELHSILPSQKDCNMIIGFANTAYFLQFFTLPYNDLFRGRLRSAATMSAHPRLFSHPVLIARTLLYLAHGIQNIHPCALDPATLELPSLSRAMADFLEAASRVTRSDHLLRSLEGLECLILEGTFHINNGKLIKAREVFRRAWCLGRDMRLPHPDADIPTMDSSSIASPSFMWYRIIHQDRYLALMLDQPASSENDDVQIFDGVTHPDKVSDCLEHTHCLLMGRIASRHGSGGRQIDLEETMSIDRALRITANQMPQNWWMLPRVNRWDDDPDENLQDVLNLLNQITHFHLVVMLHLPHMLRKPTQKQHEYSKMACANASRELLNRYIRFRNTTKVAFCCRAIDFAAFTACIALFLAHLDSVTNDNGGMPHVLGLQCSSDQSIIAEVVGLLTELDKWSNDDQLGRISSIISFLLTHNLMGAPKAFGEERSNPVLKLTIPCVGNIQISNEGVKIDEFLPSTDAEQLVTSFLPAHSAMEQDNCHLEPKSRESQNIAEELSGATWLNPEVLDECILWADPAHLSSGLTHTENTLDWSFSLD